MVEVEVTCILSVTPRRFRGLTLPHPPLVLVATACQGCQRPAIGVASTRYATALHTIKQQYVLHTEQDHVLQSIHWQGQVSGALVHFALSDSQYFLNNLAWTRAHRILQSTTLAVVLLFIYYNINYS